VKYPIAILCTLVLTACGGGGGSSPAISASNNTMVANPSTPDPTTTTLSYSNATETVTVTDTVTHVVVSTTTNTAINSNTVVNGLTQTVTYTFADNTVNVVTTQLSPLALTSVLSLTINTNTMYANAVGDINGDGLDDVVVGGWSYNGVFDTNTNQCVDGVLKTANLFIFTQNTDHTLSQAYTMTYGGSQHVFIADFNNDGKKDILLPGFTDGCTEYYQPTIIMWNTTNNGVVSFNQTQVGNTLAHGACVADINGDGYMDFMAAGFNGTNTQFGGSVNTVGGIFINNRDGTFSPNSSMNLAITNTYFSSCAVAKNTNISIALGSNSAHQGNIYTFDRNLNYIGVQSVPTTNTNNSAIDALAVDVNLDGVIDIVMMYNAPNSREVYLGTGNGFVYNATFSPSDSLGNDYYAYTTTINGFTSIFFPGTALNGVSQDSLYHLTSTNISLYNPTVNFATMAASVPNGSATATSAAVYHDNTGRTFMLQLLNNVFYVEEMQ
jgi:FG-GAP-like repeat